MPKSPEQRTVARRRAASTNESASELLKALEDGQSALPTRLADLDPSLAALRPPSGKWSVVENVRHLLFAEQLHLGGLGPEKVVWSAYGFDPETMRHQRKLPPVDEAPAYRLQEVFAAWEQMHTELRG